MAKASTAETAVAERDSIEHVARNLDMDRWESLSELADVVTGHNLLTDEAQDKLLGVPFLITRVIFRDGIQQKGLAWRNDYVSVEAMVAPKEVLVDRVRKGRLDLSEISVDPGEDIIFNDGSTGIYRQVVQYLYAKGLIGLPTPVNETGTRNECSFDLPRSKWTRGAAEATDGINIKLKCPRGLRNSEYANEFSPDGTKTRYIA